MSADGGVRGARQLRILGLSTGHHRRSMSGVPGFLFDALARSYADVEPLDYGVRGLSRFALAAATARRDRVQWLGRFYAGRLAHRAQSAELRRRTRSVTEFDVALQVHGWVDGQPLPFALYADQTRLMAARGWPPWSVLLGGEERRWLLEAESSMYERAAHVFAMGVPARESLLWDYGLAPDRVTVVGGGLNLEQMPRPRPLPAQRTILFVGRDFERKGGEVLLGAFRRVRDSVPDATLHIVGPRRRMAAAGVVSHGRLGRAALAALYSRARVFCMPSLYEPYGLPFAEAMAYGIPCVGSTAQSIPDILAHGEAGMLAPTGDERALADALIRLLLDDELASSLGEAGRRLCERVHTWERVAERMKPALIAAAGAPSA